MAGGNRGKFWRRAAIVLVLAVGVAALLATIGSARDPSPTFTVTDAPDPVTTGLAVSNTFTARNSGASALTTATFSDQLPAGSSFVSATTTRGSCSHAAGTVTCNLGQMTGGASAVIKVFFTAPSTAFQNCGAFTFRTRLGNHSTTRPTTLNACQGTGVMAADDPNFRSGCIGATQSISTGTNATATDRQNTSVQTQNPACITVKEVPATSSTDACGTGFTCKTEVSEIEHPPCSVASPCLITITFDKTFGTINKLFYNGVLVQPCTTPGVASPDPCQVTRTLIPSRGLLTFDTRFTILSAIDARLRGG